MKSYYEIPENNLSDLEKKIDRINRKAAKLDMTPIMVTYLSESFKLDPTHDELSVQDRSKIKVITIEIDAPDAPVSEDYIRCCEGMIYQLDSTCLQHGDDCPDKLIVKSKRTGKLFLRSLSEATYDLRFCPWCGTQVGQEIG